MEAAAVEAAWVNSAALCSIAYGVGLTGGRGGGGGREASLTAVAMSLTDPTSAIAEGDGRVRVREG